MRKHPRNLVEIKTPIDKVEERLNELEIKPINYASAGYMDRTFVLFANSYDMNRYVGKYGTAISS